MSKLRKIVLTAAALAALAVGGAAFAQAQNDSGTSTPVKQSRGEAAGDVDPGQSADTDGADRNESASGNEAQDGPDTHEPNDAADAHEVEDGD